jgi:hypothetical protein
MLRAFCNTQNFNTEFCILIDMSLHLVLKVFSLGFKVISKLKQQNPLIGGFVTCIIDDIYS